MGRQIPRRAARARSLPVLDDAKGDVMADVEIIGLEGLQKRLGAANVLRAISDISLGVAEAVRERIAKYPGPVSYPIRWASEKQRRWFFAQMRAGAIEVPYRRQQSPSSERLGPSWASERRGATDAVAGTRASYAPYVQAAEKQQPFHRATGWRTDERAVEEVMASGVIDKIKDRVLDKALGE